MSDPASEVIRALYRYEQVEPGHIRWVEVRRLSPAEWLEVTTALVEVGRVVRSFDQFLEVAWADLEEARKHVLEKASQSRHVRDAFSLLEYRLLAFSTALRLYHEYVIAEANRADDRYVRTALDAVFSEHYDASQAYRVVYSLRNAFQHGVRGLVSVKVGARLVEESGVETTETALNATLRRDLFGRSGTNAAVRREVGEMETDPNIVAMCVEAYSGIRDLHARVIPVLHPEGPFAARTLMRYVREVGNENPHFHEYEAERLLETTEVRELDIEGFCHVIGTEGYRLRAP
jgi:hypothetical protein